MDGWRRRAQCLPRVLFGQFPRVAHVEFDPEVEVVRRAHHLLPDRLMRVQPFLNPFRPPCRVVADLLGVLVVRNTEELQPEEVLFNEFEVGEDLAQEALAISRPLNFSVVSALATPHLQNELLLGAVEEGHGTDDTPLGHDELRGVEPLRAADVVAVRAEPHRGILNEDLLRGAEGGRLLLIKR